MRPYDARQADLLPHKTLRRRRGPGRQDGDVLPSHGGRVELDVSLLTDNGHVDPHLRQVGDQLIDIPADPTTKWGQRGGVDENADQYLSLIHISEPTRRTPISYAVFC